jgi:hypothetical protein
MEIDTYIMALTSILTVLGVLFGIWYNEIQTAKNYLDEDHIEDYEKDINGCLIFRILPLFIISLFTAIIFIFPTIEIINSSWQYFKKDNWTYDPIKATFLFLEFLIIIFIIPLKYYIIIFIRKK